MTKKIQPSEILLKKGLYQSFFEIIFAHLCSLTQTDQSKYLAVKPLSTQDPLNQGLLLSLPLFFICLKREKIENVERMFVKKVLTISMEYKLFQKSMIKLFDLDFILNHWRNKEE